MAIMVPPALASLFSVVSGMPWPEANEDNLRAAGDDYQAIADDVPQLKDYIVELVNVCLQRFDASLEPLAFEYLFTREAIQQLFKWLLKSIAMHTIIGVASGAAMDGLIQGIQFADGHRTEWDKSLTFQSLEFGAISGALSGP